MAKDSQGGVPPSRITNVIYGRDAERSHLADIVEAARAGMSGSLVVRGRAGAGKSVLLDELAAGAAGVRTLRTVGLETEGEPAFGGLRQLLDPLLGGLEGLTPPRRQALATALGLIEAGEPSGRFLIAAAVLDLLAAAAEPGPVLAIADDAHWLDGASQDALLFVARRLAGEGIALIFAAGEGETRAFEAPGVPQLELGGLDPAAALALIEQRSGIAPSHSVAARLVAETGGNPLELAELARLLDAPALRGDAPLPDPLPLAHGAEAAYVERVGRLPEPTRATLLLAALEPSADLALLVRAGAVRGDLEAAASAGLVRLESGHAVFAHPLVRSAVEAEATFAQRRRAHLALAAALAEAESERGSWHAAAAALEQDEELASELERLAERARKRSGDATAQAALTRAAELTSEPVARGRRLFAAADAAWHAGRAPDALALIESASGLADGPREHAHAARLRSVISLRTGSLDDAHRLLMDAARETAEIDPRAAYRLVGEAANAGALAGDPARLVAAGELARTFAEPDDSATRIIRQAVMSFGAFAADSPGGETGELRTVVATALQTDDPGLMAYGVTAARLLGDEQLTVRLLSRAELAARAATMIGTLPFLLVLRAATDYDAGRLAGAAAAADEGARLAREAGQTTILAAGLAHVARTSAVRGDATRFATAVTEATALARAHGLAHVASIAAHAAALHEIGLGRYEAAQEVLEDIEHPAMAASRASEECEVAMHLDRRGGALVALEELEQLAAATRLAWVDGLLERARGVTATGRPDRHFLRAAALQGYARPFELARTELAFGETLRRVPRRIDAREPLRRALAIFDRIGAEPWAALADRELRATGETSRHRPAPSLDRLTPQELAICELVAEGFGNRDIGSRLFLSPRTIDYHLRKVYPKLGIGSREELVLLDLGASEQGEHLVP
jgi:DNA-binding CsgD family transcriptional regulator